MPRKSPFKHHRFPREIILCAVRWYLLSSLFYQDVVDLLAEPGIMIDRVSLGSEVRPRTDHAHREAFAPGESRLACR